MDTTLIKRDDRAFTVQRDPNQAFWDLYARGQWEPQTLRIIDRWVTPETTYMDIGAWIGPTLLYAAQRARQAWGFEPDPVAFRELSANVALNPEIRNVRLREAFIGVRNGTVPMGNLGAGGDSTSSALFAGAARTQWTARAIRLDTFIAEEDLKPPFFVKIDIEGGEYELVPSLRRLFRRHQPMTVCLALHPQFFSRTLPVGGSVGARVLRRWRWFFAHACLLRGLAALPCLRDDTGNRLHVCTELWRAARGGSPPDPLVASSRSS